MKLAACLFSAVLVLLAGHVADGRPVIRTISAAKPNYYEATIRYHVFTDGTPLARLASKMIENWARKTLNWYVDTTGYGAGLEKPSSSYNFSATSKVHYFIPSRLISVSIEAGEGGGGAPHPVHSFATFNFGVIDGTAKHLALRDMFRPRSEYRPMVARLVMRKLREAGARDAVEGRMSLLTPDELDNFFISGDARLAYRFMPGVLAAYSEGPLEVPLAIRELGPHFRQELLLGR